MTPTSISLRIATCVWLPLLLLFLSFNIQAQEAELPVEPIEIVSGVVTATSLRVRSGPGTDSEVVRALVRDTQVVILAVDPDTGWYSVAATTEPDKSVGWVSSDFVQLMEDSEAEPVVGDAGSADADVTPPINYPGDTLLAEELPPVEEIPTADEPTTEAFNEPLTAEAPTEAELMNSEVEDDAQAIAIANEPLDPLSLEIPEHRYDLYGREHFLQLSPGYNIVGKNPTGLPDSAFRGTIIIGVELFNDFFFEALYSFVSQGTAKGRHEAGGGFRFQRQMIWRLVPHVSTDLFYTTFEDDQLGVRGSVGLNFDLGGSYYRVLMGPFVDYNRIFRSSDQDNIVFGGSLILINLN